MCNKRYRNLSLPLLSAACLLLSTGLLPSVSHATGVYKWVDDQGQVHYGERPEGQEAEKMTIRTNETTKPRKIASDEDKDGDQAEAADGEGQAEQEAAPKKPTIPPAEKRRLCNEAKTDIANISSRGRMREIDAQGNYRYLSEQERQQRLSAARSKQAKYCR